MWIKYAALNSIIGLFIGFIMIGAGWPHSYTFILAAPLASFVASGLIWKLILTNPLFPIGQVIITGILSGLTSFFLYFLLTRALSLYLTNTSAATTSTSLELLTSNLTVSLILLLFWIKASFVVALALKMHVDEKVMLTN